MNGSLFPEVLFQLGPVAVRDTVMHTWIMLILMAACALLARSRRPALLDLLVEFLMDALEDVIGRPAAPFLPLLGGLAIFIVGSSLVGILPFLEAPTRDVNTPLALALTVFFSVHYFGIRDKGFKGYLRDMAQPLIVLPLELISQVTRTLSLTLRLFGNVVSIEMAVAIVFALAPLFVPLPLLAFSLVSGLVQAYVFTALAAVYIAAALDTAQPVRQPITKESA
jgi:F-type H+-transporting ATPase subunit a